MSGVGIDTVSKGIASIDLERQCLTYIEVGR